ncbi:MAG: hypothetical protein JWM76_3415, partial [Pseudonocardiales bacterium]|nr:hypothetical protein [Pseudonocardiales bacterium]
MFGIARRMHFFCSAALTMPPK